MGDSSFVRPLVHTGQKKLYDPRGIFLQVYFIFQCEGIKTSLSVHMFSWKYIIYNFNCGIRIPFLLMFVKRRIYKHDDSFRS